ncbi:hypothetical protein BC833DRAFT_601811 [Globomyces pollinis-pini]|nr:hypothetical protein BC833DRAFT_601811 [Globomyces pollinis-pini]
MVGIIRIHTRIRSLSIAAKPVKCRLQLPSLPPIPNPTTSGEPIDLTSFKQFEDLKLEFTNTYFNNPNKLNHQHFTLFADSLVQCRSINPNVKVSLLLDTLAMKKSLNMNLTESDAHFILKVTSIYFSTLDQILHTLEFIQSIGININPDLIDYIWRHSKIYGTDRIELKKTLDTLVQQNRSANYNETITKLCISGNLKEVEQLLIKMNSFGLVPDSNTYTIMLNSFCKIGDLQQAWKLYSQMNDRNISLNTYRELIQCIKQVGTLDDILRLQSSVKFNFINADFFNLMFDAFAYFKDLERSYYFFKQLKKLKVSVDWTSLETFFTNWCMLTESKQLVYHDLEYKGYAIGKRIFRTVIDDQLKPPSTIVSLFITGLSNQNDVNSANSWLERLIILNREPDGMTYNALIACNIKAMNWDRVEKLVKIFPSSRFTLSKSNCEQLISHYIESKNTENVLSCIRLLEDKKTVSENIPYNQVALYFLNHSVQTLEEILQKLSSQPSSALLKLTTYYTFIHKYILDRNFNQSFKWMKVLVLEKQSKIPLTIYQQLFGLIDYQVDHPHAYELLNMYLSDYSHEPLNAAHVEFEMQLLFKNDFLKALERWDLWIQLKPHVDIDTLLYTYIPLIQLDKLTVIQFDSQILSNIQTKFQSLYTNSIQSSTNIDDYYNLIRLLVAIQPLHFEPFINSIIIDLKNNGLVFDEHHIGEIIKLDKHVGWNMLRTFHSNDHDILKVLKKIIVLSV